MSRKGNRSSSHYRINPAAEKSEQVLAIKFVQWDVPPLESLCNSKVYLLRMKLNRGECMSREEKNWLCEAVNSTPISVQPFPYKAIALTSLMY